MVRINFVKGLLKGNTAPNNALRFVAHGMGVHTYPVAERLSKHSNFAAELLTGKDPKATGYGTSSELAKTTGRPTARHETHALAMVLAGYENRMNRQSSARVRPHRQALPEPTHHMGLRTRTWND